MSAQASQPPTPLARPDQVVSSSPDAKQVDAPLPSNVTITTPDGKPLPPELLQKVISILRREPTLRVADGATTSIITRKVDGTEIVVVARALRGSVLGNVAPLRTFTPLDIRAYGATSIGELVKNLGSEATSDRGTGERAPIVLLNGRRLSTFEEIALYPTEAVERLEVFPETLALQYGFPANQKVINIVTFKYFVYKSGLVGFDQPLAGSGDRENGNFQFLRIVDKTRYNAVLDFRRSRQLLESDRGIIEPDGAADQAAYRSLLPESRSLALSGSISGAIGGIAYTLRGNAAFTKTRSSIGLGETGPLQEEISGRTIAMGAATSGQLHNWFWASTASLEATKSSTSIYVIGDRAEANDARSTVRRLAWDASFIGSLIKVPAGNALATLRTEYAAQSISTAQTVSNAPANTALARQSFGAFFELSLPLTTAAMHLPIPLGDLSVNGHVSRRHWSDRGDVTDFGYGFSWSPWPSIHGHASWERQKDVPTLDELNGVVVAIPNVRIYDFITGVTQDVTQISGGNPRLSDPDRKTFNIGFFAKPFSNRNFAFSVEYTRLDIRNATSVFPLISSFVKDAFPERFATDGSGILISVDARPISLFRSEKSLLRWGFNLTKAFGKADAGGDLIIAPAGDGPPPPGTLPPNSRIIDNPPGTPLPPEIENAISRIYLSAYHTWSLSNRVVLRQGERPLDLLNGSAITALDDGSRHILTISGGLFRHGIGVRSDIRWQSARTIDSTVLGSGGRLRVVYRPTVDMQVFLNLQDRITGVVPPWVKGLQIVFAINNLADGHPIVRDGNGKTPLIYQSGYLDPNGRTFKLSLRKIF